MLSSWLLCPHVRRWWHDVSSLDAIEAEYHGVPLKRAGFLRVAEDELMPGNPLDTTAHAVYQIVRPVMLLE